MKRREFLKRTSPLALGTLGDASAASARGRAQYDLIIVGAGAAGSLARPRAIAREAGVTDDRVPELATAGDLGAQLGAEVRTLEAFLAESDVVSRHVPLTPETRRLIGAARLAQMRRGA